jgi:hypothetical protein
LLIDLFTCDLDTQLLPIAPPEPKTSKKEQKLIRAKARIARDRFKQMCFANQLQAGLKFEIDSDLTLMRSAFSENFYEIFATGFYQYVDGYWEQARENLSNVELVKG